MNTGLINSNSIFRALHFIEIHTQMRYGMSLRKQVASLLHHGAFFQKKCNDNEMLHLGDKSFGEQLQGSIAAKLLYN